MSTIILGIDPGIATTGYGVITSENGRVRFVEYGCILTKAGVPHGERLVKLYSELHILIGMHKPDYIAVEKLFFSTNVTTAFTVGEARGVVILVAAQHGIAVHEFTPNQVKQGVSAYGKADKRQVQKMVKLLLNLKDIPKPDDAADALAIAICCANTVRN